MAKRQWRIVCYDSTTLVWEGVTPFNSFSTRQAAELLARLAARHLTDDEVVSASRGGRASERDARLRVSRNGGGEFALFTGGNPHYVARIEQVTFKPEGSSARKALQKCPQSPCKPITDVAEIP